MSQPPNPDPPSPGGNFPFSPEDALQFMQRMWNPLGVPMPGFVLPGTGAASGAAGPAAGTAFPNPATMFATLDPAEIDRKIGELRVIENWLQMTLNLMQMSIKTMELQKASLEALRSSHSPAQQGGTAGKPSGDGRSKK